MDDRCQPESITLENDEVCRVNTISDAMGRNQTALVYPALEVECPAEGSKVDLEMAFTMPYHPHHDETSVQLTFAAAHGSTFDKTEGIVLEAMEGNGRCDWDPGFQRSTTTACPDWLLNSNGTLSSKHCGRYSPRGSPGSLVHYTAKIWNFGGCEGLLRIEASIDDRNVNFQKPSSCSLEVYISVIN